MPFHDKPDLVLLFFREYERDSFFPYDRYLKRVLRPVYRQLSNCQTNGITMACRRLMKCLTMAGYDVHLNDYRLARKHPEHPVGLIGYPFLLDGWSLPNPAVLGPALYDHPKERPDLMRDERYGFYIVGCDWMKKLFGPYYGGKCVTWYIGIETDEWPDYRSNAKKWDVLIYDKIHWNRDDYSRDLIEPVVSYLDEHGISHVSIRYGHYDHASFREALKSSSTMLFFSEHETQGMAYQEAMSCNLPVLAWDNGFWLDPKRALQTEPVETSSVPYFSPECGERFRDFSEFPSVFTQFWERRKEYEPRAFVEKNLSMKGSANAYMELYRRVADIANSTR